MREFKFRVWDKEEKEFVKLDGETFIAIDDEKLEVISGNEHYGYKNENVEVMQYTGLKDKNGKEIYEGDILQGIGELTHSYVNFVVGYDDYTASFIADRAWTYSRITIHEITERDFHVIGNIYENPELLQ